MNKIAPAPKRAKIFWSGRSQAVRLPKEFRFDVDEVVIRRDGSTIVLELPEAKEGEWDWLDRVVGRFSSDAIRSIEDNRVAQQERPDLDKLFK
jgi:antitoxin VapB